MSVKSLYEALDIDDMLQTVISNYPGSTTYTQYNVDSNKFEVLIEYLGQTCRLKFDISEVAYRSGIEGIMGKVNIALENIRRSFGYSNDVSTDNNTGDMFKRLFDICKTYDVDVNISPMTINHNICRVRVLKDKQALDYLIDLDEIAQYAMPMDEAFITRIDMAAKELNNTIHGFDAGSVNELIIKEENEFDIERNVT